MANYTFSSDLVDDILFRAGEPTDGTSDYDAAALRYLNRAYQAIWMGGSEIDPTVHEEWYWLRADPPGVLNLSPSITTGTVSVTNNSTAITFSSAPAASVAGYFFKVDTHPDIFRISAHTAAAAAATLDAVYTGATGATAAYRLFKLEYSIASDVLRLISPMRVYKDNRFKIEGMDLMRLEDMWPLRNPTSGVPRAFAQITESKVRFSHYGGTTSTDLIRVEYDYLKKPSALTDSGSEEPLVPLQHRKTLTDCALMFLFSDKNDNRASDAGKLAISGLKAMQIEHRHRMVGLGADFGKILPRQSDLPANIEPLRTEQGLIIG